MAISEHRPSATTVTIDAMVCFLLVIGAATEAYGWEDGQARLRSIGRWTFCAVTLTRPMPHLGFAEADPNVRSFEGAAIVGAVPTETNVETEVRRRLGRFDAPSQHLHQVALVVRRHACIDRGAGEAGQQQVAVGWVIGHQPGQRLRKRLKERAADGGGAILQSGCYQGSW